MKHFKHVFFGVFLVAVIIGLVGAISVSRKTVAQQGNLNLPITVKEVAGVGTQNSSDPNGNFPTFVVVPFPVGNYQNTNQFRLEDGSGKVVPAQFDVLTRWWNNDQSIRHLKIEFQPSVAAFTGNGTGIANYYLKDSGGNTPPQQPVTVTDSGSFYTVNTGPLRFEVKKSGFNIIDKAWLNGVQIISSGSQNGGRLVDQFSNLQLDSSRSDITVVIEESGPMRIVIKASAPTRDYVDPNNPFTHGWAVRIYAYAGKPFVKIDYQLQNSPLIKNSPNKLNNLALYYPLYFNSAGMQFSLSLTNPTAKFGLIDDSVYAYGSVGSGVYLAQESHDLSTVRTLQGGTVVKSATASSLNGSAVTGWVDISDGQKGVTAIGRNFWQMWPNEISIDGQNNLGIGLFPSWGKMWDDTNGTLYPTTLKWFKDMQHVMKSTLLYFHGSTPSDPQLENLAKTFQYYPVPVVPYSHRQLAKADLDMGGFLPPFSSSLPKSDIRTDQFQSSAFTQSSANYMFHWNNFRNEDANRRKKPCNEGGWVYGAGHFIATEDPTYYWLWDDRANDDISLRPQSFEGYQHNPDWNAEQVSENPYCGGSWRVFPGGSSSNYTGLEAAVKPGTIKSPLRDAARDVMHMWFQYLEPTYYTTANPWIKDWCKTALEFQATRLEYLDPYPTNISRAKAHALDNIVLCANITGGNTSYGNVFQNYYQGGKPGIHKYLVTKLIPTQDPETGAPQTGSAVNKERAEFVGMLGRATQNAMRNWEGSNPQAWADAFNYLSGLEIGLRDFFNECYNCGVGQNDGPTKSGTTISDHYYGYALMTGDASFVTHIENNIKAKPPYTYDNTSNNWYEKNLPDPWNNANDWSGQYHTRLRHEWFKNPKADTVAPQAVADLSAIASGNNVTLRWTAPNDADLKRYHIVWANQPITSQTISDPSSTNWWAAKAVGPGITPTPGAKESHTISSITLPFYAAMFTFDKNGNLSQMSNVAYASQSGNNAQLINVSVPTTMDAGAPYPITVTMKNTGVTTWVKPGYLLGYPGNQNVWGSWQQLTSNVAPGASATFGFSVIAPPVPGTYTLQMQMVQSGVEWFGDATPPVAVTVSGQGSGGTSGSGSGGQASQGAGALEVKRVGPDLTTSSAPPGTTVALLDTAYVSSANPAKFSNLASGSYTIQTTDVSGYAELVGTCSAGLLQNCVVTSFSNLSTCDETICSSVVAISNNLKTKIVFQYVPVSPPPSDSPPVVTLLSPANGSMVPAGNVTFTFSATDDKGLVGAALYYGIGGVWQPYTDYNPKLSGTSATASITLPNVPAGTTFTWDVFVCDNGQPTNCSFSPSKFTVTTQGASTPTPPPQTGKLEPPAGTDAPPKVTLISPVNGATVPAGDLTFVFSATDDTQLVGASLFLTAGGKTLPYTGYQPSLTGKQATASITVSNIPAGITFQWDVFVCGTGPKGLQCSYAPQKFTATTKLLTTAPTGTPGTTKFPTPTPTPTKPLVGKITPVSIPEAPTGLSAEVFYGDRLRIVLRWQDAAVNEQGYRIYKSSDGVNFYLADSLPANSIAWNDLTKLVWDQTAYYQVKAWNSAGESAPSNTVGAVAISTPSGLSANAISAAQIQLSWIDNSSAESRYVVERSPDGQEATYAVIAPNLPANTANFTDSGLTPGTPYWYRVRAETEIGKSSYSNTATAYTLVLPPVQGGGAGGSGSVPKAPSPSIQGGTTF